MNTPHENSTKSGKAKKLWSKLFGVRHRPDPHIYRPQVEELEPRLVFTAGSLDPTFGVGGKVVLSGCLKEIRQIALQPDGKIVAAANDGCRDNFNILRFNTDGSLDSTFDGDGIASTQLSDGWSFVGDLHIQPDGKIIVAGSAWTRYPGPGLPVGGRYLIALARFNANGTLDATFGSGGEVITPVQTTGADNPTLQLAYQPNGRIVIASGVGHVYDSNGTRLSGPLVRYSSNGTLDTGFANNGIWGVPGMAVNDVAVQQDGRIVIVGAGFDIARLYPNGTFDTTFGGGNGIVEDTPNKDVGTDVQIRQDQVIVASGWNYIARYWATALPISASL